MHGKIKDKTDMRFGNLVVLGYAGSKKGKAFWDVRCDCGIMDIARSDKLDRGEKTSCGCKMIENRHKNLIGGPQGPLVKLSQHKECMEQIIQLLKANGETKALDMLIDTLNTNDLLDAYQDMIMK